MCSSSSNIWSKQTLRLQKFPLFLFPAKAFSLIKLPSTVIKKHYLPKQNVRPCKYIIMSNDRAWAMLRTATIFYHHILWVRQGGWSNKSQPGRPIVKSNLKSVDLENWLGSSTYSFLRNNNHLKKRHLRNSYSVILQFVRTIFGGNNRFLIIVRAQGHFQSKNVLLLYLWYTHG